MEAETTQQVTGMIVGGWGYVWAAYGITWLTLVSYTIRLLIGVRNRPQP